MDNVVSWIVLTVLAWYGCIKFLCYLDKAKRAAREYYEKYGDREEWIG